MRQLNSSTIRAAVGVIVAVIVAFVLSAATWGPLWRFANMPTPEEWSALWAFATLMAAIVAAWFALRQLEAMRVANTEASKASENAANASRAAIRPYLDVRFEFIPSIPGDPTSTPTSGFTSIVVENRGQTAAKGIRLKADPVLQSSGVGKQGDKDIALEWIREKFSGDYVFEHLSPGKKLSYVLDLTKEQMDPKRELPQRYEVEASYWDVGEIDFYTESHVLDATPWHLSRVDADPLAIIARQMRTMNNYERTAQRTRKQLVDATRSAIELLESLSEEWAATGREQSQNEHDGRSL